jgi:hypothetical protein
VSEELHRRWGAEDGDGVGWQAAVAGRNSSALCHSRYGGFDAVTGPALDSSFFSERAEFVFL